MQAVIDISDDEWDPPAPRVPTPPRVDFSAFVSQVLEIVPDVDPGEQRTSSD